MTVKVLIADDSSFQRKIISEMLSEHEKIKVIYLARDGVEAVEKVKELNPDVVLLDILMPRMDGLAAFKQIMREHPTPTIIFSVLDPNTLDASIQALLLGAFDYIIKPGGIWKVELPKFKKQLILKVLLASKSENLDDLKVITDYPDDSLKNQQKSEKLKYFDQKPKVSLSNKLEKVKKVNINKFRFNVIVIATSVGGPKTLRLILSKIPKGINSPILIVQHLNEQFMGQFAESLNTFTDLDVKLGKNGEKIDPGVVYLSPGGKHMEIVLRNDEPHIRTFDDQPINYCKPSADPLFFSAARIFKKRALGIILTGLGNDGVAGLKAIKSEGGLTIAESKETSIVYGMPKVAAESDAAQIITPNYMIKNYILKFDKKFGTESYD
jgi:two-component system chemotaxis response regulator CheB